MKKISLALAFIVTAQLVVANPLLIRGLASKGARHFVLKHAKGGKVFLKNIRNGDTRKIKLKLDKLIKMPKKYKGSSGTSKGFLRDKNMFWQKYKKKFPADFSPRNLLRIKHRKSPVVDRQWMKHHKDHSPFNGQKIEHHHLGHGSFAVPLPKGLHRGKGNSGFFHKR